MTKKTSGRITAMSESNIDQWVKRLNDAAKEMDAACDASHPATWHEQTAACAEKWKKLASKGAKK